MNGSDFGGFRYQWKVFANYLAVHYIFCTLVFVVLGPFCHDGFARLPRLPFAPQTSTPPHPAVVRIVADEGGSFSKGSGTLVEVRDRHGFVVTNWHVVRDAKKSVRVFFADGFQSAAQVIHTDANWDLAALAIWRPTVKPVTIASRAPHPGDLLTIAGYGEDSYQTRSGKCTQYVSPGINMPYEMVEVSVQARQGDSGGPIFNRQGELAGVLFGASGGRTSGSYAGRVQSFLQESWAKIQLSEESSPTISTNKRIPALEKIRIVAAPGVEASSRGGESTQSMPLETFDPSLRPFDGQRAPNSAADDAMANRERLGLWQELAGTSPFEQTKTLLAIFGAATILMMCLRYTSKS
ncbi:MAG: serine protease [Pirellulaceae bacterium]|nr:serine protease [Pirellulaceae bacterium]